MGRRTDLLRRALRAYVASWDPRLSREDRRHSRLAVRVAWSMAWRQR